MAIAADSSEELVFQADYLNTYDVTRFRMATACYIDFAVMPYCHSDRQMKPSASLISGETNSVYVFHFEFPVLFISTNHDDRQVAKPVDIPSWIQVIGEQPSHFHPKIWILLDSLSLYSRQHNS